MEKAGLNDGGAGGATGWVSAGPPAAGIIGYFSATCTSSNASIMDSQ